MRLITMASVYLLPRILSERFVPSSLSAASTAVTIPRQDSSGRLQRSDDWIPGAVPDQCSCARWHYDGRSCAGASQCGSTKQYACHDGRQPRINMNNFPCPKATRYETTPSFVTCALQFCLRSILEFRPAAPTAEGPQGATQPGLSCPGIVIAAFDASGRYPNLNTGKQADLYRSQDGIGIWVRGQYVKGVICDLL
jgi:hypothetical protein